MGAEEPLVLKYLFISSSSLFGLSNQDDLP